MGVYCGGSGYLPRCPTCGNPWGRHRRGCFYDDPGTRRLNARVPRETGDEQEQAAGQKPAAEEGR